MTCLKQIVIMGNIDFKHKGKPNMNRYNEAFRRGKAACLLILLSASVTITGCGQAQGSYSVEGRTGEESRVTDEPYSSVYGTMEYAREAEPDNTPYGDTSEDASDGATEEVRKRKTIIEDVSLVNNPEERRVIMVIPKGSKVDVIKDKEDGWYRIRFRGTEGYVKTGYFVEDWEAEQEERRQREAEEKKRKEEEKKRQAEEAAKRKAEAEKKKKEEEARKKAEEEKKKKEEEAKKKAEEEAKRKAEEEKKKQEEEKKKKEEEAKKAEEEAKRKEEEERRKAEAEERARAMANREVTRRLAETVNLRDPDDEEILFGIVPTGSIVYVLADLGDGWYLVDYDGMEGMIKGGYFTEDDP